MAADKSQSLWTPAFALLCCAAFFGSAQHALPQPTFPLYITSLGGRPLEVGLPLSNGVGVLICSGVIQSVEFFWRYLVIAGIAGGLRVTIANRAYLK